MDWRVATLRILGMPVTQGNLQFFGAWHQWEGGGDHNSASYNPLNTTRNAPGAVRSINSVGVKAFDSFDHGVQATAATLANYPGILAALKSGNAVQELRSPAVVADLNKWVSGRPSTTITPYVAHIASTAGAPLAPAGPIGPAAGPRPAAPAQTRQLASSASSGAGGLGQFKQALAGYLLTSALQIRQGQPLDTSGLLALALQRSQLGAAQKTFGPQTRKPTQVIPPAQSAGGGYTYPLSVQGKIIGTPYSGTHTLYGNWESDNAVDIAAPVGTPVYAPTAGVIGNQFGSLGQGGNLAGLRVHVIAPRNEFYMAHLSKLVVKPGEHVKAGQLIGYSGEANGVGHLHIASRAGNPLNWFSS